MARSPDPQTKYTALSAWPYWLTMSFVPLVVLAVAYGGWTILLIPIYGWVLMPLLDIFMGKNLRNPDPETPDGKHFRTEHLLVHHPYVGTPRDTVTARYNEGFHRAYFRILCTGFGSAWRAEAAQLARRKRTPWHLSNPIWKYLGLQAAFLGLAYIIGGWAGVGLFAFRAFVAIWQLELTNYVEHYGLTREHLGGGKYEPVKLHHSWDSAHKVSGLLLINLQRHADHHVHPMRRFPLLQVYDEIQVPMLPTGYPPMTALAMVPPLWRRMFNPRVRAWRRQFYPEITDWRPYKDGTLPMPKGSS